MMHYTDAQRRQQEHARERVALALAGVPAAEACGFLTSALANHPDITPEMLHSTGNLLSRLADDMERNNA